MKKFLICLVSLLMLCSTALADIYPLAGYVCLFEEDWDLVVIDTFGGDVFSFYGIGDWKEGDIVAMLMYDNHTEQTEDDVIVETTYCGNLDELQERSTEDVYRILLEQNLLR